MPEPLLDDLFINAVFDTTGSENMSHCMNCDFMYSYLITSYPEASSGSSFSNKPEDIVMIISEMLLYFFKQFNRFREWRENPHRFFCFRSIVFLSSAIIGFIGRQLNRLKKEYRKTEEKDKGSLRQKILGLEN